MRLPTVGDEYAERLRVDPETRAAFANESVVEAVDDGYDRWIDPRWRRLVWWVLRVEVPSLWRVPTFREAWTGKVKR